MADISGIASNIKTPFFYLNICDGVLFIPSSDCNTIIVAPMLAAGTTPPGEPVYVFSFAQALELFGTGSIAADMVRIYENANITATLQVLPILEDGAWVAAVGTITASGGPAVGAETRRFSIAGQDVSVAVGVGMTNTQIATALRDAINATPGRIVAATAALGVVTITSKQKGELGNDIQIVNLGTVSGTAGITYTIADMAGGAGIPDISDDLLALKDCPYDCIVSAWNDETNVEAIEQFLNCTSGRWSYTRMLYGEAFFAVRGTSSELVTWASDHNFLQGSAIGFCPEQKESSWQWAACYAAALCQEACEDPARSYNGVELPCVECDTVCGSSCFSWEERELLACHGISTWECIAGGKVVLDMPVTLLQELNSGLRVFQPIQYVFTHVALARDLIRFAKSNWDGKKIADDGTDITRSPNTLTPALMKAQLVAWYGTHEGILTEDVAGFSERVRIERDRTNPTRVNIRAFGDPVDPNLIVAMMFGLVSNYRTSDII